MERKKITVKHYLNTRAKVRLFQKEKFYPLYIQIIVNGKKAQIKSRINEFLKIYRSDIERYTQNNPDLYKLIIDGFISEKQLTAINKKKTFPLYQLLVDEVAIITRIIVYQQPFNNPDFTLVSFGEDYEIHTTEITKILDDSIKDAYQKELREIFLKTIDQDENRNIFTVANYFIHFVNWNNSFSNFYNATNEILASELKSIEGLVSNELRTAIKAYLSYLSKVNILNRLFERREAGKISTLSFLDWQTEIKDLVHKEFKSLYGEQKALEYILSLDSILNKAIKNK